MPGKIPGAKQTIETAHQRQVAQPVTLEPVALVQQADLSTLQRVVADPCLARPSGILALQRAVGNRAVTRLLTQDRAADRALSLQKQLLYTSLVQKQNVGVTTIKFTEAEALVITPFQIIYRPGFKTFQDGVALDTVLKAKLEALCNSLIKDGIVNDDIRFNQGVRSSQTAHRWHTAWMIRNGKVPLQNLKDLENGQDEDGNTWWRAEWNALPDVQAMAKSKANASTVWSKAYAAEGYKKGDSHRLPCNCAKGVTNHKTGKAIDATIPWTVGAWSAEAKTRVDNAGLKRPVSNEPWHFELK